MSNQKETPVNEGKYNSIAPVSSKNELETYKDLPEANTDRANKYSPLFDACMNAIWDRIQEFGTKETISQLWTSSLFPERLAKQFLRIVEKWQSSTPAQPVSKESAEPVAVYFEFQHPESKEVKTSRLYNIAELLETDLYSIQEAACICNCQPVGETNVVECNCQVYLDDFELIGTFIQPTPKEDSLQGETVEQFDLFTKAFASIYRVDFEVAKDFIYDNDVKISISNAKSMAELFANWKVQQLTATIANLNGKYKISQRIQAEQFNDLGHLRTQLAEKDKELLELKQKLEIATRSSWTPKQKD